MSSRIRVASAYHDSEFLFSLLFDFLTYIFKLGVGHVPAPPVSCSVGPNAFITHIFVVIANSVRAPQSSMSAVCLLHGLFYVVAPRPGPRTFLLGCNFVGTRHVLKHVTKFTCPSANPNLNCLSRIASSGK